MKKKKAIPKQEYCSICGKRIPDRSKRKIYCSYDCMMEGRRRNSRIWGKQRAEERKYERQIINEAQKIGWGALAQAIVCTAIDDIRACSPSDIMRYERSDEIYEPESYIRHKKITRRTNYFDAKTFLLGERVHGITGYDGTEIYKLLLTEKGLRYDGERVFNKVSAYK